MGRKDKSDIRKPEILKHLYQVLEKEGLEGTTLAKVADSMGVNSGLLIHYYKTKDEMIVAMVDYMLEMYANIYISKLNEVQEPQLRLNNMIDTFFCPDWTKRGTDTVFYSCYALSFRNKRVKKRFKNMYDGFRELLANEIRNFIKAGIVKVKDPVKTADIIITLIEGLNFYRTALDGDTKAEEAGEYFKKTVQDLLTKG